MEVTTWVKRRQRERQAVSREVEVIEPRNNAHWSGRHAHKHGRQIRWDVMGCSSGRSRGLRARHVSKVAK